MCVRLLTEELRASGAAQAVELPFNPISSDTAGGMGGTCVIRGCVPKKLMVYASHYSEDFKDAEGYGWTVRTPCSSLSTPTNTPDRCVDGHLI